MKPEKKRGQKVEDGTLCVPEAMIPSLKVKPNQVVEVGLGGIKRRARVRIAGDRRERVSFCQDLASGLLIPKNVALNVVREKEVLRLGPLVGIMAYSFCPRRLSFGEQDGFFRRLLTCLEAEGALGYVFTPSLIDWSAKRIYGYYLPKARKKWKRGFFAFPDVCYDRYFRLGRDGVNASRISEGFKREGVKWFNCSLGNKWMLDQLMKKEPEFHTMLPATYLFRNKADLASALNKHGAVYAKPMAGSKGSQVFRISRSGDGYYFQGPMDKKPSRVEKLKDVMDFLSPHLKDTRFLLQEAIPGPKRVNHFDIRVMVQKESSERWMVSGMVARMALKGSIVSNLHQGGRAVSVQKALVACDFPPEVTRNISELLETMAVKIAEFLDRDKEHLGELGLDFLLDEKGKIWFLEANIKPGRRAFSFLGTLSELLVLRPVRYAKYLAGF